METYELIGTKHTILKDPHARLLYGIDLDEWLTLQGGTTLESVSIGEIEGVENDGPPFISGSMVLCWVMGGQVGQKAWLTFRFVCADSSTDDRTIHFKLKER